MLLTITNTRPPATDLSFLLHKHPDRAQSFDLSFGRAHVFYPDATEERCTAALLVEVDPVHLVRRRGKRGSAPLEQYVNDRPYAASSHLSVAIARVFGSALAGKSDARAQVVDEALPLEARLPVLPCRGGASFLTDLFEPLGYAVEARPLPVDAGATEWGAGAYYDVRLRGEIPLRALLSHLYVLVPVLDDAKHYFVGDEEVEKLLSKGESWLAEHPRRADIARRYLRRRRSLADEALRRLAEGEEGTADDGDDSAQRDEEAVERPLRLDDVRRRLVCSWLEEVEARSVIDLGCGEGKLLAELLSSRSFDRIVGVDVSHRSLEHAARRLRLDRLPERQRERIELLHGSLSYRDSRFEGFDAAALVEVIEHLDAGRLETMERVVFACARPGVVIVTTPNREYNALFEDMAEGAFRHGDHRFEWTREEFRSWASRVADRQGYAFEWRAVGEEDAALGPPTQAGVFRRE